MSIVDSSTRMADTQSRTYYSPIFPFKKTTIHIKISVRCIYYTLYSFTYSEPLERAEKCSATFQVGFDFPKRSCQKEYNHLSDLQLRCIRSAASSETAPGQAGVADPRRPRRPPMGPPNLETTFLGQVPSAKMKELVRKRKEWGISWGNGITGLLL